MRSIVGFIKQTYVTFNWGNCFLNGEATVLDNKFICYGFYHNLMVKIFSLTTKIVFSICIYETFVLFRNSVKLDFSSFFLISGKEYSYFVWPFKKMTFIQKECHSWRGSILYKLNNYLAMNRHLRLRLKLLCSILELKCLCVR